MLVSGCPPSNGCPVAADRIFCKQALTHVGQFGVLLSLRCPGYQPQKIRPIGLTVKGLRKKYLLRVSRVIFKKAEKIPMKPEDSSKANIVAPENGWLED